MFGLANGCLSWRLSTQTWFWGTEWHPPEGLLSRSKNLIEWIIKLSSYQLLFKFIFFFPLAFSFCHFIYKCRNMVLDCQELLLFSLRWGCLIGWVWAKKKKLWWLNLKAVGLLMLGGPGIASSSFLFFSFFFSFLILLFLAWPLLFIH